jgi:glycosyltransferase involved in cell wall biosynthesis
MKKNNFDLIQCEILWSMPTGIILKHLYKKPLIFVNENVEYLKFIEMGKIRQAEFVRKLEKFSCEEADLVIALSEIDKKNIIDIHHIPRKKIEIIPHGVDTDLFKYSQNGRKSIRKKYKIPEKSMVITFLGKLDYIPNVTAIKLISELIYPEIIKQHPNSLFLIIGQNYESIIGYKKDNIIFTGYVPPKELANYLSASDIFIVPLDSGSGTRLKTLEAASCSLPIVSTLKGVEGQNFVHGNEIFLTKEIDRRFINYILELIENEALRKRVGTSARKKIEAQYSWKKIGEKFERVYSKILEDSS